MDVYYNDDPTGVMYPEAREYILSKTDGYCLYCGADLTDISWHADHLYPKSRGGCKTCIENLYPTCPSCNSSKGDRLLEEWRKSIHKRIGNFSWLNKVLFWFENSQEHIVWENGRMMYSVSQDRWNWLESQEEKRAFLSRHQ